MQHVSRFILGVFAVAALIGASQAAEPAAATRIEVKEHLNRAWHQELLTYRVDVPTARNGGRMTPVLKGPNGAVPAQLCTTPDDFSPGVSAGHGELAFMLKELPALGSIAYDLSWVEAPAASTPPPSGELTGARIGLRFALGEKTFDPPAPAAEVPGPVAAWRLPDGTWTGGSRLYGAVPVSLREARVIARGPVYTRVLVRYQFADGNELRLTWQLANGDYATIVTDTVTNDAPECGWELTLGPAIEGAKATVITGSRKYAKETHRALPAAGEQLCYLSPWGGDLWFPDSPGTLALPLPANDGALLLAVVDPGLWVKPQERPPWSYFNHWSFEMIPQMWAPWQRRRMPIVNRDGAMILQAPMTVGERRFAIGLADDASGMIKRATCREMSLYSPLPRLNEVKDMVLEWPEGTEQHPYLYENADVMGPKIAATLKTNRGPADVAYLKGLLDQLGTIDLMRNVMEIAGRYDAVMGLPDLLPADRALIRAQTAYAAYCTADPYHWSFERGENSGNPNMTVSRLANLGVIACALRDHPMSRQWADHVTNWMVWWLDNVTDDTGGWPESSHYARVSWSDYVQYAVISRQAGYTNFFDNPKFMAMAHFYEETLTPLDPLRQREKRPARVGAPYGRGTRGGAWGISGLLAKALLKTDPELSKVMEWSWRESGYSPMVSHSIGGQEDLYVDRNLPAAIPTDWKPRYLPSLGYLLRSGVGTPAENYLLFTTEYYQCPDGQIWPSDTGAISKWFADGCPIGGSFRRIPETSVAPLVCRVMPALNWDPKLQQPHGFGFLTKTRHVDHAYLPGMQLTDVVFDIPEIKEHHMHMPKDVPLLPPRRKEGDTPLTWRRQLMLAMPVADGDPTYLVLRDTVAGHQPTQWHFWTLSDALVPAGQAVDRDALRADKKARYQYAPARELSGDRFTAIGQFSHDLDYFVAEPRNTPRYTLRYGTKGSAYAIGNFMEYQDCLHLELEDDGTYYVVMVPHRPDQPAPTFTRGLDGRVLRIDHAAGTDWCLLSGEAVGPEQPVTAAMADGPSFDTVAGMVQSRGQTTRLILGAAGVVQFKGWEVSATAAVTVQVTPTGVTATSNDPADLTVRHGGKEAKLRLSGGATVPVNIR